QLDDPDPRVARYAAVTLAQAGDQAGLEYLGRQLHQAQLADRPSLLACLRNCTRFPFAVLLHALSGLHGQGGSNTGNLNPTLREAVSRREEEYLERVRRAPGFRQSLLDQLVHYQTRPGSGSWSWPSCDLGVVLTLPRPDQLGALMCRSRKLFLQF